MPTRLENTIRISIPDIQAAVKEIPNTHQKQFMHCFQRELAYCVRRALQAPEGVVVFSDMQVPRQPTGQYVMTFEVLDRSRRRTNSYNFHGQNTSQWTYAGCILYQDGSVSTHH